MTQKADQREVLDVAVMAGHILLENGAELYRVEETMKRICHHFGVQSENAYILSNGIFLSAGSETEKQFSRIKHIPVRGSQLHRVVAVNQLSREMESGQYTLEEVKQKLEKIKEDPGYSLSKKILASGLTSAVFCVMFGGSVGDCIAALFTGFLLYLYLGKIAKPHFSKIVENIGGGILITVMSIFFLWLHIGENISPIISGALMPLVPGLAFTNGIRDIADGDYLSGTVRLIDAVLVFLSIAAGVGFAFGMYQFIAGGTLL